MSHDQGIIYSVSGNHQILKLKTKLQLKIFLELKGCFGSRRRKFALQKEYQLAINQRQKAGCCSVQTNFVNQNFSVKPPHTIWFGAITYIPTDEGTLYLSTYIDDYSRQVISYRIDNHMRYELVVGSLETALLK